MAPRGRPASLAERREPEVEVRPHRGCVCAAPFAWAGTSCVGGARRPAPHPPSRPCAHAQVSKASSELMSYCEQHARSDPLVVGVPASENPFKDKKPCIIL